MAEYIEKEAAVNIAYTYCHTTDGRCCGPYDVVELWDELKAVPAADVVQIPEGGIGEVSDGHHTFNGLYRQRLILTAALVKAHKGLSWKSRRHEDGELCFGGGWFIVGFDTPDGGYTYHYKDKYWDLFECVELPRGKHWDGHTEDDVERLLSIPAADVAPVRHGRWKYEEKEMKSGVVACFHTCSVCGYHTNLFVIKSIAHTPYYFCPNCGAKMEETE